jgi:prolyl oligopeptidase
MAGFALTDDADPYLWLEEVERADALAWVRAHNKKTEAALCDEAFRADKDAIYEISTRPTNIPFIARRGPHVYNFWQDADHIRGLWRRTTLEDYRTEDPTWETVLDLDRLAADEGEDWVWGGCASLDPDHRRGLVTLSRGGADAALVREFDLVGKRFVPEGFTLAEAKGGAAWVDGDTLMVATTLGGEGTSTTSGYPRTVRLWRRGLPFEEAPVVFEGEASDVRVGGGVDREPGFERTFFRRQITFEEGVSFVQAGAEPPRKIDLPLDAAFEVERDWLLVRLKTDWALPRQTYKADMLLAIGFEAFMAGNRDALGLAPRLRPARPYRRHAGVGVEPPRANDPRPRHAGRRLRDAEDGAQRLRCLGAEGHPARGRRGGRRAHPLFRDRPGRARAAPSDGTVRLRRLRRVPHARIPRRHRQGLARTRRRMGGRQYPRRR